MPICPSRGWSRRVPTPLKLGAPTAGYPWPWTICRWVQGTTPVVNQLESPRQFAIDLAAFLGQLQAIDACGGPPSRRGVPLMERDSETRVAISELADLIDQAAVLATWERALAVPKWDGPQQWIHGDLSPFNLLVKHGHLCGVIDFGMMGTGDPACDLVPAWNLLPSQVRELFRDEIGVNDATWERGKGWAPSIALIQLPYYRDRNPNLAANARHVIDEVLGG